MPKLKRLGIAMFAWVAALVVLTGVARAGQPFVYCHTMESLQSRCCCVHPSREIEPSHVDTVSAVKPCCCERGTLPSLPHAASGHAQPLPSTPPLVAILEPPDPLRDVLIAGSAPSSMACARARLHPTRPPLSAAASCARLSVFLI